MIIPTHTYRQGKWLLVTVGVIGFVLCALLVSHGQSNSATALSGSAFDAGHIIDDAVFYNKQTMTASQIQSFLNSKVPSCDTDGAKLSEMNNSGVPDYNGNGSIQRWEWGKKKYNQTKFICLRNYTQNIPQMEAASGLCGAISAGTNRSASQIISSVASACGINPQVLVVLLEKEQSLVMDTWPLNIQYNSATGFDCPDTAPCDPAYAGFFYQVYHAARQFKVYKAYPNDYNYIAGRTNRIYWNPDLIRCGSSQVYIENQATAALYIYTPYRPNQAALNNLYGTGDSCSSYGNRNFWRIFTDWFGSTTKPKLAIGYLNTPPEPYSEEATKASFWVRNDSRYDINLGRLKVVARSASGTNYDFASVSDVIIKPGHTYTYEKSRLLSEEGAYTFTIGRYAEEAWQSPPFASFGLDKTTTVSRTVMKRPTITSGISGLPSSVHKNTNLQLRIVVKNNSSLYPIELGHIKVAVRDHRGNGYDFPSSPELTLQPGESYTFDSSRSLPYTGDYTFWIASYHPSRGWSDNFPASDPASSVWRLLERSVKDTVTLTEALQLDMAAVRYGDSPVATFTIKNHSDQPVEVGRLKVVARDSAGGNHDFPSSPYLTLAAGQEYTYSQSRALNRTSTYSLQVESYRSAYGWSSTYPNLESSGLARSIKVVVKDSITLISSLALNPSTIHPGNTTAASFTIKNHSTHSATVGRVKVVVRDAKGNNYDFPSSPYLTLAAGQEYTYSQSRLFDKAGTYNMQIFVYRDSVGWSSVFPSSESAALVRSLSIVVR